jgi:hypothetical protein
MYGVSDYDLAKARLAHICITDALARTSQG